MRGRVCTSSWSRPCTCEDGTFGMLWPGILCLGKSHGVDCHHLHLH